MKKFLIGILLIMLLIINIGCSKKSETEKAIQEKMIQANEIQNVKPINLYLTGSISSNLNIHMKLEIKGEEVSGSYYYDKYKVDIPLKGKIDKDKNIQLDEYDQKGIAIGHFKGKFTSDTKITGEWSDAENKKQLPFIVDQGNINKTSEEKKLGWVGSWKHINSSQFFSSEIIIKNATDKNFKFTLDAHNGANMGNIEDETAVVSKNTAVFESKEYGFKMTFTLNGDVLKIQTEGEGYFGAGVYADGDYKKGIETKTLNLKDVQVFENNTQEQNFKNLVGDKYERFRDSFQSHSVEDDLDGYGASVHSGWVRGIAPWFASIIMYTQDGRIWAAVVDENDIKYYTNTQDKDKLPKTIEKWNENHSGVPINYMSK